jgi:polyisoprenoid-binding protein YceI
VGTKVTGSHEGTVNLQSGYLNFDNKDLVGGEFVIDMTSIVCTDLSGKGKASIEGHLKSDDFFSVDDFPSASLKISDVKKQGLGDYMVTADITIKGTTQAITFKTVIEDETAKATLIIDRTEFGIIYKSGNFFEELADKAIYDEFEMTVNLKF